MLLEKLISIYMYDPQPKLDTLRIYCHVKYVRVMAGRPSSTDSGCPRHGRRKVGIIALCRAGSGHLYTTAGRPRALVIIELG